MTLLSKFRSRKGMHFIEFSILFIAITIGVGLMVKLTKSYMNARWQGAQMNVDDSFYDKLPKGQWTDDDSGGCKCTDWALLNACGVGYGTDNGCGLCQKIAFRGCSLGCPSGTLDRQCFTPGQPVPDCPECEQADPCSGVTHTIECWSDDPSQELLDLIGNGPMPCAWGQMIVEEVDCESCGNDPASCEKTIGCVDNGTCRFECTDIEQSLIGTWYIPCDPDNVPPTVPPNNNPPLNNHTHATFVDDGECGDEPCEFQCGGDLVPNVDGNGQGSSWYNGVLAPLGVCECPQNGGNPNPWTLQIIGGVPDCKCMIPGCTGGGACSGLTPDWCDYVSNNGGSQRCSGWVGDNPDTPLIEGACHGGNFDCSDVTPENCMYACTDTMVEDVDESSCNQPPIIDPPDEFCCEPDTTQCPSCVCIDGNCQPFGCDSDPGCPPPFCAWINSAQGSTESCEADPNFSCPAYHPQFGCGQNSGCHITNCSNGGGGGGPTGSCHPCPKICAGGCCMNSWPDPLGDAVCIWDTICGDVPVCLGGNATSCAASGCFWY